MNITRNNFPKKKSFILNCLKKSDIVSFDFEMSGVLSNNCLRNNNTDTVQFRYWKAKENVRQFIPIQIGICGFEIDPEGGKATAYPFNFYILPFANEGFNQRFYSQASTFNFLMKNNFNFNTLFYEGNHFISKEDRNVLEANREVREVKKQFRADQIEQSLEYQAFSVLHWEKVKAGLEGISEGGEEVYEENVNIRYVKLRVYKFFEDKLDQLFPHLMIEFTYDNDFLPERGVMTINARLKTEEEIEIMREMEIEEDGEFAFMDIIEEIIKSKKPIVTHNGFLDILHLYNKFIGKLPETQSDFKSKFREQFPNLYDTKFMLNNSNYLFDESNLHTSLFDSYMVALKDTSPEITIPEGFDYKIQEQEDEGDSASHEAGFDALMTGVIFLRSLEKLDLLRDFNNEQFEERAKVFKNKLPLGGIKSPFNLEDKTDYYSTPEETIFHCYTFTKQKKIKELITILEENYGEISHNIVYGETVEFFFKLVNERKIKNLVEELDAYSGRKIYEDSDIGIQYLIQTLPSYQDGIVSMSSGLHFLDMNPIFEKNN